jgi:hypothetical protein
MKFTLRIDHKNLIFISSKGSPLVQRWKLDIQAYDMNVEHIKGEDNIPADYFSRQISKDTPVIIHNLMDNEEVENIISKYHGPMPGHFGINKTVSLMKRESINFPKLREEVKSSSRLVLVAKISRLSNQ